MPIIEAEQLGKTYRVADKAPGMMGTLRHFVRRRWRTIEAVREISFTIEPGEVVGFLGPNGAGKTTALKLLSGLVYPTGGRARVAGHTPFARKRAFLEQITLVMGQKQQLIWDLPALDSLRINAAMYGIDDAEARRRTDELAELLELGAALTQPVRKLSLGQRMKAELLAALLHRPQVLFLDEPTLGLDVNAQAAVRSFLREYNARHGATVLLTSHYMADITALCKRVLLIHEGRLFYDGPLDGILQRFAPYREVRIETRQPVEEALLEPFGEIESVEGVQARLIVQRERLTDTIGELLRALDVVDLTVSDPPIEEIVGRLFDAGSVEPAGPAEEAGA